MPEPRAKAQHRAMWRWLVPALAALCLGLPQAAPVTAQVPDQMSIDIDAGLEGFSALLADPATRSLPATALIGQAIVADHARLGPIPGLRAAPDWGVLALPPAQGTRMNMRLALTMLSQTYGDDDNGRILSAQTDPDRNALVLREGRADLAGLRALMVAEGLPHGGQGQTLILAVPLVIWDGAALDLGPGDVLALSRADGAFVMNFGHLRMQGATIRTEGNTNPHSPSFRPFVTTADSGTVAVRGATFSGLGFGRTLKFTGFSVMRSLLRAPDAPAWVEGSLFQDTLSIGFSGDDGLVLTGNQIRDPRGAALVIERTRDAAVISNLFAGAMPTNAIRLQDGSVGGLIAGNVVLTGNRSGIVVRNEAHLVEVVNNVVWQRGGGGIAVVLSDCALVRDNLVIENEQKGIEIRQSLGATVAGNTILSNHSAGIWVSLQAQGTETLLTGNTLAFNGSGVSAARGERIVLMGNDFSGQYLQFLGGDIAPQSRHVARNMLGAEAMVLTAAGRFDMGPPAAPACAGGT